MHLPFKTLILFIIISTTFFFEACRKDEHFDTNFKNLKFSTDSVLFDTVFTTIGTVTKNFKVYNNSKNWIKISNIQLAKGSQSNFRINVDGKSGTSFSNIELAPNDSIFVFVNATIDPTNSNSPLIVSDSILFTTNGNMQKMNLIAWGQDAYYHTPNKTLILSPTSAIRYSYAKCKTPWKNDKPHVIYGYTVVDSDSTLVIPAGTKIYLHKNAVLWVYSGGTLKVNENGTATDEKVIFQGDRLEVNYKETAGQWGAIWLSAGSKNNVINQAIIKNGTFGIQVDTVGNSSSPTLTIKNTIIKNMSAIGILGQGSTIYGENIVIANCSQNALALTLGGSYEFNQCTIGNYWEGDRKTPSLQLNNYYVDATKTLQPRSLVKANFNNCIIYGTNDNEIGFDKTDYALFNYKFTNCLLRIATTINITDANFYVGIIKNSDPLFTDISNNIYKLKSNSPAIDKGAASIGALVPNDIDGNSRIGDMAPDIGAYEFK